MTINLAKGAKAGARVMPWEVVGSNPATGCGFSWVLPQTFHSNVGTVPHKVGPTKLEALHSKVSKRRMQVSGDSIILSKLKIVTLVEEVSSEWFLQFFQDQRTLQ